MAISCKTLFFVPASFTSENSAFKDNCVKSNNIDPYYQWQKCSLVTLVSGSTSFVVIRRRFLQKRHQTGVELLKLTTNLQF